MSGSINAMAEVPDSSLLDMYELSSRIKLEVLLILRDRHRDATDKHIMSLNSDPSELRRLIKEEENIE